MTDLETNLTKSGTVCVRKTVERREPKKGAEIVGERLNSTGQKVFIVKSTDDELLNKEANLCAKARRNLELQIVPQDLIEECEEEIIHTMRNADRADPDAAKKRIFDGFAAIGIMPRAIEEYLGHGTDTISPAEFQSLREIGAAIRDGQTTWAEVMEAKGGAKPKTDRATVNLDDIKPGNANTHTPVDAPVNSGKSRAKPAPELSPEIIAKRDEAYSFLSAAYDEQGGKIDAVLADHNQPPLPEIARDTTDEEQIAALIIAKSTITAKKGTR